MGNPQHLEWLLEGVESWNKRRKDTPFTPDLSEFDVRGEFIKRGLPDGAELVPLGAANFANGILNGANFGDTNLRTAIFEKSNCHGAIFRNASLQSASFLFSNLENAKLRYSKLQGAKLNGALLRAANFHKATVDRCNVQTIWMDGSPLFTNLGAVQRLSQSQLNKMAGDTGTILPQDLTRPGRWQDWRSRLDNKDPTPALPDDQAAGDKVSVEGGKVSLSQSNPPDRNDLETLFDDLKEDVASFHRSANLGNLSPEFATSLDRFLSIIPDKFADLDQIRFGVQSTSMRMRFTSSKAEIEDVTPERVGYIEAILMASELIAARLPGWAEFLAETLDEKESAEANKDQLLAKLGEAKKAVAKSDDIFSSSFSVRLAEYIDTASIEAYVAAQRILINATHAVTLAVKKVSGDLSKQTYDASIKTIAAGFVAATGDIVRYLAGFEPSKYAWVERAIDWLSKL